MTSNNFSQIFKNYRLRSGIENLSDFGRKLSEEGFIFEDSIFSKWQNGSRIPKGRNLLLAIIRIFLKNSGIISVREANRLLESLNQGYLTDAEIISLKLFNKTKFPNITPERLLRFAFKIGISKKILRSGWVREGVEDPESVAEHSFRLSVLSMIMADFIGLDKEKLIKMSLLHDLGEVVTGDIVWSRGHVIDIKKRQDKEKEEAKGISEIFGLIDGSNEYAELYEEMIERRTEEAKIFWQLDKLEMAIQAQEYENSDNKDLGEFFVNADLQISFPYLKKVMGTLNKKRRRTISNLKKQV